MEADRLDADVAARRLWWTIPFAGRRLAPYCPAMAKPPKRPKDPAKPTRAKAARPVAPATPDALADLLNPAINKGTAGMGSGTGLQPPPDNSFDRRADFSAAHKARKSTAKGFEEAPQRDYGASPITGLDPALARELGLGDEADALPSPRARGEGGEPLSGEPGEGAPENDGDTPSPDALRASTSPRPAGRGEAKYRLPRADLPTNNAGGVAGFGGMASQQSLEKLLREGRQEFAGEAASGKVWMPHRPPRPEKSEGGKKLVIQSEFEPKGDQPEAIRELVEGVKRHDRTQVLLGRDRLGQNLHHGQGDRGDAAPGAHPRAEQNFGGAALRRVQVVLPRQRGGIFRLLLRLLPAGGLRPAHRHLHREGILDQRADRPHAPFGDARAARARRRRHRRLGVLHLRHRLGGNLFGHDLHAQAGRQDRRSANCSPTWWRCNTSARRPISTAARSACAATPSTFSRRITRTAPGACILFGDEIEKIEEMRPAHRAENRRTGIRQDLRQLALRHAAPDADPGHGRASSTNCAAASTSSTPPAACWKRSASNSARCSTWK